jgi:hypothetical protein
MINRKLAVHGCMLGSRSFFTAYMEFVVGLMMPTTERTYPTRNEVIEYLLAYEQRYQFPIRPVHVDHIEQEDDYLDVYAGDQYWRAKAVVSATGWSKPHIPNDIGREKFKGYSFIQHYMNAAPFKQESHRGGGRKLRRTNSC